MSKPKRNTEPKAPEEEACVQAAEQTTEVPAREASCGEEQKGIILGPEDLEKINQALAERQEYLNAAQRVTADFDNYRKRTQATRAEAIDDGVRDALTAILPTLDNLDRALQAMEGADESMVKGVEMVRRVLLEDLKKLGLEEIDALGQPFDPELHEAVMRSAAEEGQAEGQNVEVFKQGYRARGKVIRYAMVRVAYIP